MKANNFLLLFMLFFSTKTFCMLSLDNSNFVTKDLSESISGHKTFTGLTFFNNTSEFNNTPTFGWGINFMDFAVTFLQLRMNQSASQGADMVWVLPPDNGGANAVLSNNGTGTLSFNLISGLIGSRPACAIAARGRLYNAEGAATVADILYVCQKSAADTYLWVVK